MIKRIFFLFILLIATSCSHLQQQKLETKSQTELLSAIQIQGEGRGRLSFNDQQFVFSFDSLLTPEKSWVLSTTFPLHGEENLIFSKMNNPDFSYDDDELAQRMDAGIRDYLIKQKKNPAGSKLILAEMRRFIRFTLSKELKLTQDENSYVISQDKQRLHLKKSITPDIEMMVEAQNLTESIFKRLKISFLSQNTSAKSSSIMDIELFFQ